jgi:hypothetical protein
MADDAAVGPLVVAFLLATSALAVGAAGVSTAANSQVAVESVTVDPSNPQVGEDVTITATIRNFESSPAAARINEVTLRSNDGVVVEAEDAGTIGAGGSIRLPLTTAFEEAGRKRLTVWVYGQSEDGSLFNAKYPVSLSVSERDTDVRLSLAATEPVATESRVNVTVANGAPTNISTLDLTLSGPDATVDDSRRVNASLASGRERVVEYDVTFGEAGSQPLTATLGYRDADGDRQTVTASRTFAVEPANVDADLDAEVVRENGTARLDASLTNFGNVPLEDVRLRAEAGGDAVARTLVPDVRTESTRTVSIGESRLPADTLTLRATYEAAGERHETTTTVAFSPTIDGNITLTGIEVIPTGGSVRLAGSASNVGETDVTGAVVSVVGTERVTPVSPAKSYFVGNVPAGEFTSFELTARLAGNRTDAVPIRISYIADGTQYARVVEVSIADGALAAPAPPDGGGGPDGPPGGGGFLGLGRIDAVGILLRVAAVVAVGGGAFYWWRRRGDDEEL